MAGSSIKGITIRFEGDTTRLDKALRQIQNSTKDIDKELRNVDRALKFNPTSVDLWRQKQDLLKQKISETKDKLDVLKQAQAKMDAEGVDKNSKEYRQLQREIIETESKLKHFETELRKIGNVNLKALSEQFKKVGDKMMEVGKNLTTHVTAPLAAVGAVAATKFAEVDKTMQLTNSTMGNTKEQADLLNKAMKEAAASSTYGMSDAATATLNFARAGLSAEEAAAALAPAMALAAGEGGELDTVSAGLVATINGFHGSFDEAAVYADVFANACNNSALDVNSLSTAMSVAAPIFSSAGYKVKDAALYMGVMANNGIEANKAANSLKTGIARLVSPSKQGAEMMDQLGISITNADGTMKDSVQIQKELHDAFGKLSESEQIAAASAIFGKNQMAPWLALINTAPSEVDKLSTALDKNGTAMEMQEAMMSGFGGSLEKLKSGLDVAATSLGEALAPAILKVANGIQMLVDWFNNLSPTAKRVIAVIGVIAAAIGPLLVVVGVLASSIGSIISLVGTIAPLLGGVGAAVGGLASGALLPIIAVIGALIAIGVLLYKNWDKIKATALAVKTAVVTAFTNLKTNITNIWNAIKSSATATWNSIKTAITNAITNAVSAVKTKASDIKTALSNAWDSIKSTASSAWSSIKEKITGPFESAKDKISEIISKIKGMFPINIGNIFTNLKLPHFTLNTSEIDLGKLGKIKYPTGINVSWYAQGGIFDGAQVIGVGENGPEAVVPLNKFWDKLDKMQSGDTVINININGTNKDPREIAEEVKRVLIRETNQRRLAWQ